MPCLSLSSGWPLPLFPGTHEAKHLRYYGTAPPLELARCNRANVPMSKFNSMPPCLAAQGTLESGQLLARYRWLKPAQPVCFVRTTMQYMGLPPDPTRPAHACLWMQAHTHKPRQSIPILTPSRTAGPPSSMRCICLATRFHSPPGDYFPNNTLVWALACPACRAQISMRSPFFQGTPLALIVGLEEKDCGQLHATR